MIGQKSPQSLGHTHVSFNAFTTGAWSLVNMLMNLILVNGLLASEDGIMLCSLVLTKNRRLTDRQTTDGQSEMR